MSFAAIPRSVRHSLAHTRENVVLAVSGGVDSMVLLHAAAQSAREHIAAIATFDHGTGPHAREACRLVVATAQQLGLPVVSARASQRLKGESAWRAARWNFLRTVARRGSRIIATAHTRDDQVETVAMRVMRGSSARGTAGLYARSDIVRPLLEHSREEVSAYAAFYNLKFAEDPTNLSRAYLRNRLRLEILPALRTVAPSIDSQLLEAARRAARWRNEVENLVDALGILRHGTDAGTEGGKYSFTTDPISALEPDELKILLPAIAARAGITLDRRGVDRAALLVKSPQDYSRIQLSGGYEMEKKGNQIAFTTPRLPQSGKEISGDSTWGQWKFRRDATPSGKSPWTAFLPDSGVRVRAWHAGDRLTAAGSKTPRRVKRFLSDAGIAGADRKGWPVVLVGDEIVWIPGIRRSALAEWGVTQDAASNTSSDKKRNWNGVSVYVCERID